ncbi:SymE family type I addiction module toxin [Eleftheria terrae]
MRLRGKWLRDAGFEVDTQVRVRVMAGCLVLTTD